MNECPNCKLDIEARMIELEAKLEAVRSSVSLHLNTLSTNQKKLVKDYVADFIEATQPLIDELRSKDYSIQIVAINNKIDSLKKEIERLEDRKISKFW